ncbi:hypothetical protein ACK1KB_04725 [Chryseobacterium sp. TY3]
MTIDVLHTFSDIIFGLKPLVIDSWRNEEDFIMTLLIVGAFVFLLLLILGVVIGLLFIAIVIGLVSAGIISTSVLVGFQQRSVSKGFKTFFTVSSIFGSTIVSVIAFLFMNMVYNWEQKDISIAAGILCGIGFGWLIGFFMYKASHKIILFLQRKYKLITNKKDHDI